MLKNRQPIRRFSESLKLKILAEITKGNYTKAQICDMYGIGRTTVNDWIRKYMRDDLMNHRVIVQTMDEQTKVQKLQKEIALLKELLLKKDLDALVLDSYLELAAKDLGYKSVAELKKKLDIKL
jgi:transposase-like protein